MKLIKKLPRAYDIKFSPDGKFLARASGASVSLYDGSTFEPMAVFKDIPYSGRIEFSQDSKFMAVKSTVGKIAMYDLPERKLQGIHIMKGTSQPQDGGFCYSCDGKSIYNCVYANNLLGYITKVDADTGKDGLFYFTENSVFRDIRHMPEKNGYDILGFSRTDPANTYFLLEYREESHEVKRFDLPIECLTMLYHPQSKTYLAFTYWQIHRFSDDLSTIISEVSFVERTDLFSGNLLMSACLTHDGRYLALAFPDRIKIIEVSSFSQAAEINHSYLCSVCFSPDDQILAIGGWSNGYLYRFEP